MVKVEKNIYQVRIDVNNPNNYLPADLGLGKGDLITFNNAASPVRFPASNVANKYLQSDPTSDTGLKWGSGSSSSSSSLITLKNNTGSTILAGTIVTFDEEGSPLEVRKASSNDGSNLYISSDDYTNGADMECYGISGTICNVLCTSDAVSIGDKICLSSTAGLAHSGSYATIGIALTSKASGDTGAVKVQLGMGFTIGTTDLEDGTSNLPKGHIYYYYEESEEES